EVPPDLQGNLDFLEPLEDLRPSLLPRLVALSRLPGLDHVQGDGDRAWRIEQELREPHRERGTSGRSVGGKRVDLARAVFDGKGSVEHLGREVKGRLIDVHGANDEEIAGDVERA